MTTHIHPTAIIHPNAKLAENIYIEAGAIIGEHVCIDEHTTIGAYTIIEGITTIGKHNQIGHHSLIGGKPQDMKYKNEATQLIIGDHNTIREFVSIHTGTTQDKGLTSIGNHNWIMSYVHLAHDCCIQNHTILSNNAQLAGHVHVHDYAIIGGMTGIHQFVRVGAHAMIGGSSALVQDVPPYVLASGNYAKPHGINSVGLSRRNFNEKTIALIKQAYKLLYRKNLSLDEAKNAIQSLLDELDITNENDNDIQQAVHMFLHFLQTSERGIVR
jgi:UDP-N-acetylglucosamine acyltransferase